MAEITGGSVRVTWETDGGLGFLTIVGPDGRDRFCLTPEAGRITLGLDLAVRDRPVDVSIQPGVLDRALTVRSRQTPPADVADAVSGWIVAHAIRNGVTVARAPSSPSAAVGSASFPMLAVAYDRGAGPLGCVPRWAVAPLAATRARELAAAAVGRRCSRPLVAALATALVPEAEGQAVALYPIALVRMGGGVLDDDTLRVIVEVARWRPPEDWPSKEDVTSFRRLATRLSATAVRRLLREAATLADGPKLLRDVILLSRSVGRVDLGVWPSGLVAARAHLRDAHPRDAEPEPLPASQQMLIEPLVARPARVPARPLPPPSPGRGRQGARVPLEPAAHLRRIHGTVLDGGRLRLVLPATGAELDRWGRRLDSCVGSFVASVRAGVSQLIGVEVDDGIRYCLELTRQGTVRQFLAARNRPVPVADARTVIDSLASEGIIALDHPDNARWARLVAER